MSLTPEFGTIKQIGAVVIAVAVVLAAGTVVGQAPELFGADVDDPEASIEFDDQSGDGTNVTIQSVSLSDGGFVVVTNGDTIVGVSEYLGSGTHENVTVEQRDDEDLEMLGQLTATVHQDVTGDETFVSEDEAGEDEAHDRPYIDGGYPVSETATVTMAERDGQNATGTSYVVESVDAPETVTTDDSIVITTVIRNPNDFEDSQHVDFRLDGELRERQVLSLGPDETRELNYTIDLSEIEPGEYIYGIYTNEDGELGEFTVEERNASVTVLEAESDRVVADATLDADGFLAVEVDAETETESDGGGDGDDGSDNESAADDANASIVGTSDPLEAGDHENVTIDLEESLEDGEEASVVVYEGDPADLENATVVEVGGEPVAQTVTIGESVEPEDGGGDENESEGEDGTEGESESEDEIGSQNETADGAESNDD